MTDILKSQTTIPPSPESLLAQIRIVEENISRLKLLVETGFHLNKTGVPQYCLLKSKLQIENLITEFQNI
jgi:hypothetical protein